jgi:predicted permease
MSGLAKDLQYAARSLVRRPGFAAVVVLTLGLGIGLNAAVFSLVDAVLLRPLPVERPEELAALFNREEGGLLSHSPMAYLDYVDLRERATTLDGLLAHAMVPLALEVDDSAEMVMVEGVTGNAFMTLGVKPQLGRLLTPADDLGEGTAPVAVLSHRGWVRRFGADPQAVGRTLRLNGREVPVVGVAEESFPGIQRGLAPELWLTFPAVEALRGEQLLTDRGDEMFLVMGRLRPGATFAEAAAEVETIGRRLAEEYPDANRHREIALLPLSKVRVLPGVDQILFATSGVVLGLVSLVLLIAAANIGTMMMARALDRQREVGLRLALGAGRWRILRQLLVESLMLALAGGALGLLTGVIAGRAVDAIQLPLPVQLYVGASLDWRVLAWVLMASVLVAVVFGFAPALAAARSELRGALLDGGRTTTGGRRRGLMRDILVVTQVALSLVLLVGAGLCVRSALNAHRIDPGFDSQGVATLTLASDITGTDPQRVRALVEQLLQRARAMPGVTSAAVCSHLPLGFHIRTADLAAEDDLPGPDQRWPEVDTASVGPDYFAVMGIPFVRGQGFSGPDDSRPTVVINQTLATTLWPGEDPIGKRVRFGSGDQGAEVIGVVRDGRYRTLGEEPRGYVYRSYAATGDNVGTIVVRTTGDPKELLPQLRQLVREIDPAVPVVALETLEEALGIALLLPRGSATLLGIFGLLGLVLAAVGLSGVLMQSVAQRRRELGIRQALGAEPGQVARMVVGQGLRLTGIGIVIGLGLAMAGTRVLRTILYGVDPVDMATFAAVAGALLGIAAAASYLPARLAARVDPAEVLRAE